jgi:hypothetical protein
LQDFAILLFCAGFLDWKLGNLSPGRQCGDGGDRDVGKILIFEEKSPAKLSRKTTLHGLKTTIQAGKRHIADMERAQPLMRV